MATTPNNATGTILDSDTSSVAGIAAVTMNSNSQQPVSNVLSVTNGNNVAPSTFNNGIKLCHEYTASYHSNPTVEYGC